MTPVLRIWLKTAVSVLHRKYFDGWCWGSGDGPAEVWPASLDKNGKTKLLPWNPLGKNEWLDEIDFEVDLNQPQSWV